MPMLTGRRVSPRLAWLGLSKQEVLLNMEQPGDYGKTQDGRWIIRPPRGEAYILEDHEVIEHKDGTITVSPSINTGQWHGYLERGTWLDYVSET